ncbi:MAG TPA: aminotransferase class V-fold PLP-dependent enzyme [Rhodothermales bacterium]|nr:aminotransferase class V-fold PLP-dependent enzyme [Rhodothermales bacterium]
MNPFLSLKHYYEVPKYPAIELRAFTHGLMPRSVPAMMQRFTEDWQQQGVDAWNHIPNHWKSDSSEQVGWWNLPEYLADAFIAPMLGAPAGACILLPNVHAAITSLMTCDHLFRHRKTVVVSADAFPSVLFPIQQWAALYQLEIRLIPTDTDGFCDQDSVYAAIQADTALVFLSHVGFTTSEVLSHTFLREVAKKIHQIGGLLVVDGYHATGAIPTDIDGMEADLYVGGLLKEASGSTGNGYLYIRPGLDLKPRNAGWFADAAPFSFNTSPAWHPTVRRRFMGGTTAIAPLYHAIEGLKILLEVGIDLVRAHTLALTAHAIDHIKALPITLRSPVEPEKRGPMLILEMPHADHMCHYLKKHHIFTDSRKGNLLRLAPFVWNNQTEIDQTFEFIGDTLKSKSYLHTSFQLEGPVT